eukprot:Skav229778  [mRNA]  locus=scaffold519:102998:104570:+ [translate_table: standard]
MSDTDTSASEKALPCGAMKRPAASASTSMKKPAASASTSRARGRGRGRGCGKAQGSSVAVMPLKASHSDAHSDPHGDDSEGTSASEETQRIRKAEEEWNAGGKAKRVKALQEDSTDTESAECLADQSDEPKSSSATDFCKWILDNKVDPEQFQQTALRIQNSQAITMGEFCAGMCSGTMAASIVEKMIQMKFGGMSIGSLVETVLVTEMCTWKSTVARKVCESCSHYPTVVATTGEAARSPSPVKCHIAVNAIECDDISSMTTTPRSVMDPDGKSGRSYLEFLEYLSALPQSDRPVILVIECVNKLHHMRKLKSSDERGTALVSKSLEERGYAGEWKMLQTKNFALPQSRQRVYGIFVRTMHCSAVSLDTARILTSRIWSFVSACQVPKVENLATLLTKHCGILDDAPSLNTTGLGKKRGRPALDPKDRAHVPKWVTEHRDFKEKHGLHSEEQLPPLARKVIEARTILQL